MKIGIVGLGLIGGSILKNLSDKGYELYAVTRNKNTLDLISNTCKECSNDISILRKCNVVFVCTPINKILETLDKLEQVLSSECIVTDVASVKSFVTEKKRPYKFIPSHPMAGTENSGYEASFKELFEGAKWVLTPYYYNETRILENLIKEMGAKSIISNAKEHDEAVALISHLPMYVAQCLFKTAADNNLALKLASSGFRDTTRLAMTNLTLAKDMMTYNKENIFSGLNKFLQIINTLKDNYTEELLNKTKIKREKMYSNDGKNVL